MGVVGRKHKAACQPRVCEHAVDTHTQLRRRVVIPVWAVRRFSLPASLPVSLRARAAVPASSPVPVV